MTWAVRPAREADIAALAAVAAASYRFGFAGILDAAQLDSYGAAHFTRRFAAEWPHLAVAGDAQGRILGFVEVRDGTLDMLFVLPEATGGGCARDLLRAAEAMGAQRLECFAANHRARRFYEREGWVQDSAYDRPFAGKPTAFVTYRRPLIPAS